MRSNIFLHESAAYIIEKINNHLTRYKDTDNIS